MNSYVVDTLDIWVVIATKLTYEEYKPFKILHGLDTDNGLCIRFFSKRKPIIEIITYSDEIAIEIEKSFLYQH